MAKNKVIQQESINDRLAHSFVTMTANLQRLSAGESLVVVGMLKELEADITAKLYDNPTMSSWRKSRYDALLKQTQDTIKTAYTKIDASQQTYLRNTAGTIASGTSKVFDSIGVALPSVALSEEQLSTLAKNTLIEGAPSAKWWAKQSTDLQEAFAQQMRIGYASGETVDQLVQRVRGTATGKKNTYVVNGKKKVFNEFSGGIMDTGTRQAEALVRTSTQQIAADAKMEMFRKNADVIKGVMWLSTLDMRTTKLCAARDGLQWDLDGKPVGHELSSLGFPPAHWNCRSTLVPITKSFEELGVPGGLTQKYLDAIGPGTRASMKGEVPASLSFDSWFRTLPEADQKAYLGNTKYDIWKDAGLSFADMVDQRGNPLTIQQLADAYGYKIQEAKTSGIPNVPKEIPSAIIIEQQAQLLAAQQIEDASALATKEAETKIADFRKEGDLQQSVYAASKDNLTGNPETDYALLTSKYVEEETFAKAMTTLDANMKADYVSAKIKAVHNHSMSLVDKDALPSVQWYQYNAKKDAIDDINKAAEKSLADLKDTNKYLKTMEDGYLKNMTEVPWNQSTYNDEFLSWVGFMDNHATKQLTASQYTGFTENVNQYAIKKAQQEVIQDQLGSATATLSHKNKLFAGMVDEETDIFFKIQDEVDALPAFVKTEYDSLVAANPTAIPSELDDLWAQKMINMKADLYNWIVPFNQLEETAIEYKAFQAAKAQVKDKGANKLFFQKQAYDDILLAMQKEAASAAQEMAKDVAGTSLISLASKSYDLTDAVQYKAYKKHHSMLLSKYKTSIKDGKTPNASQLQAYSQLQGDAKTQFDDALKFNTTKQAPITQNMVPEPNTLQMSQMEKYADQAGSNEGGFYRDTRTGQEYYIKFPASEDVARNELLAAKIYEALGVDVPELTLITDAGRVGIASKVRGDLTQGTVSQLKKAAGTHDAFAIDAWLANWDVTGLTYDNLLLTPAGTAIRVDVGGSLRYRAMGSLKGNAFGDIIDELETLRDSKINANSAAVFKTMKKADVEAGVKKVLDMTDTRIRQLVKEYGPLDSATNTQLANTLIARKNYLAKEYPHLVQEASPVPAGVAQRVSQEMFKNVENSRINGYTINADKDMIEDQSILVWFEKDSYGNDLTNLQFKYTAAAENQVAKVLKSKKGITFESIRPELYAKQLVNGNAISTEISHGAKQFFYNKRIYEAKMDGITIRVWTGDGLDDSAAIMNQVQIIAKGKTTEKIQELLGIVEKQLGINIDVPDLFSQEEMYLRMIARHSTQWGTLNKVDAMKAAGLSIEERIDFLRRNLSNSMGVEDITKLPDYNPQGRLEAFEQGRRRWYMPGATVDKARMTFVEDNQLYHVSSARPAYLIDAVLNGGGTMTPTTDKLRKGISWTGMSPEADMRTGGADYFFTRVHERGDYFETHSGSTAIFWKSSHIYRLDAISYDHDAYGRSDLAYQKTNAYGNAAGYTKLAYRPTNETIFKGGLSIFDDLDYINTASLKEAKELHTTFKKHGWNKYWVDGRPMTDIIRVDGVPYNQV